MTLGNRRKTADSTTIMKKISQPIEGEGMGYISKDPLQFSRVKREEEKSTFILLDSILTLKVSSSFTIYQLLLPFFPVLQLPFCIMITRIGNSITDVIWPVQNRVVLLSLPTILNYVSVDVAPTAAQCHLILLICALPKLSDPSHKDYC